jgi:3-isopropylmalate/(R)-2-methylmalate dehydratase large subunit
MGLTISEKILARASGKARVDPGDIVFANVDRAMVHDVSGPGVIKVFEELVKQGISVEKLWDPSRVWVAEDHFVPATDKQSAANIGMLEEFVKKYGITKYYKYGLGQYGICHTLSHEEAIVLPGELYVGGDSHTNTTGALGCLAVGLGHTDMAYVLLHGRMWFKVPETMLFKIDGNLPSEVMAKDVILKIIGDFGLEGGAYKAMQFAGSTVKSMNMDERLTLTNMTTEAGAKNGIVEPDQTTVAYLAERTSQAYSPLNSDPDAQYAATYEYEAGSMEPLVAKPHSPSNTVPVREIGKVEIDKAYIGSCTGAKLNDLREVAKILNGRRVKVRTEVLPAAHNIFIAALREGLVDIFLQAGAVVGPPTCGACCGAHMGVLRKDEVCVSTTNRNFPGRMGDKGSFTYLASPKTVAASAVTGHIAGPWELR